MEHPDKSGNLVVKPNGPVHYELGHWNITRTFEEGNYYSNHRDCLATVRQVLIG